MRGKLTVIVILLSIFFCTIVSAANVGVSPANVVFKKVLRGGYSERPIIVTVDTEEPTIVSVTSRGEISSWLEFESNFSVSKSNPHQLMLSVSPPTDMPNGNYTGFVTIKSSQTGSSMEGHATGVVIPTLDLFVTVEITDKEFVSCKASNFKVTSVEKGDDVIFTLNVLNEGNVRLYPTITFDIWDQDSVNLIKQSQFSEIEIAPTQSKELLIRIPSSDLNLGQYWVDVSALECYAEKTLTFDILEEGALRASGVLEGIIVAPWADIKEIVPIAASFRNTGEKALDAKFVGQIKLNNKIVQLIESDEPLFIPIENQSTFQFYFTPQKSGKYVISGRVFYDGKRTYEQSAILNVKPSTGILKEIGKTLLYAILIFIIIVLLFKIRQERKIYSQKLKGVHK